MIRDRSPILGLLTCLFTLVPLGATRAEDAPVTPDHEKPFRASAQAFVDAYAKRDAKTIGAMFTERAEYIDETGDRIEGRAAIVALFEEVFTETPEALVEEIDVERVRMINANVALEEGRVASTETRGGPRAITRYIAIHVRADDGVWRIDTLKDRAANANSRTERLAELDWMVGEWVSEEGESVVHTEGRWSDDGNFLLRRFTARLEGRPVMSGVQRIGWDPVRREVRSWTFDSEGGHVTGTWKRNGDQWLVVSSGFTADGQTANGLAVYTIHDSERLTWQFRGLVVDNELRTNMPPVVLVRKPPSPGTPAPGTK